MAVGTVTEVEGRRRSKFGGSSLESNFFWLGAQVIVGVWLGHAKNGQAQNGAQATNAAISTPATPHFAVAHYS